MPLLRPRSVFSPGAWVIRRPLQIASGVALVTAVLILGSLPTLPKPRPPQAQAPVARLVTAVRTPPPKAPAHRKPAPPSAFAQEQQMSFSQLLDRWNPAIAEAARRFGVSQVWIRAVMQIESGGRTMMGENQPIVSGMGAMGLMQLMPQTYEDMRKQYGLGSDPFDPHDNILAGAAYLRQLRDKYGYPAMFAAYNDGPGNLEARMMGRGLLPMETQNYIVSVTNAVARGVGGRGAMVKFTRPNGEPAMINAAAVSAIRAAFPGEYAPGVLTVVTIGRLHQGIREPLAEARAMIRAHGGGV
ncbi:MAG TPA: transglycosylase SLT domain-containing protein [Rhizomicrobium sp.]|nr:transglycosylase SLT domain-containing protein [Rhizomicrobium sp.]